jgi:transmembrane sensor
MSREPDFDTALRIAEQAAEWLERLKTAGPQERAAYLAWLRESRLHVREMLLATAWDRVLDDLERGKSKTVIDPPRPPTLLPAARKPIATRETRGLRWPRLLAIATSILILLALTHMSDGRYRTQLGEQRIVKLLDGSSAHLNTLTHLTTEFTEQARRIELIEGQATFDVEHEPARPFIVSAGQHSIRAIGTRFDVYKRDDEIRVAVIEGTVEIRSPMASQRLSAHDAMRILDRDEHRSTIDPNEVIAWQQRRLIFHERSLDEIASEFNRYNRTKIEIADEALRQQRFSGVFDADDPLSFTTNLAAISDIAIERSNATLRVRQRRP